jgi:V8-like Glu-specific endopeptidase
MKSLIVVERFLVIIFTAGITLSLAVVGGPVKQMGLADRQNFEPVRFAAEDHRLVVDAHDGPYSAIGRFKGAMTCTAAIVLHPKIIVTASHCLTNKDGTLKLSDLMFEPGYQAGHDLGRFKATLWSVGSQQSLKQESVRQASQDWAILILERAPTGVRPFLLRHQSFSALRSLRRQILMPGYSIDVGDAERVSVDPACSIRGIAWDALIHDCRGSLGSSGAPLLVRDGFRYVVVGVHTGAMYASDNQSRAGVFVGNRAISSEMFIDDLLDLLRRLNNGQ